MRKEIRNYKKFQTTTSAEKESERQIHRIPIFAVVKSNNLKKHEREPNANGNCVENKNYTRFMLNMTILLRIPVPYKIRNSKAVVKMGK